MSLPPPPQALAVDGASSPPDPRMVPDELKAACAQFFGSPAGQLLIQALRHRKPDEVIGGLSAHDLIRAYAKAEGYQNAVDNLTEIIHESSAEPPLTREAAENAILHSPAD